MPFRENVKPCEVVKCEWLADVIVQDLAHGLARRGISRFGVACFDVPSIRGNEKRLRIRRSGGFFTVEESEFLHFIAQCVTADVQ